MSPLAADLERYVFIDGSGSRFGFLHALRAPGFHAVCTYRLGNWSLGRSKWIRLVTDPAYMILNVLVQAIWGIEISRHARIGPGFYIGHFGGINIAPGSVIGRNCNLSQSTTIGFSGQGDKAGVPTIGDDVYIGVGARLFGKIRVGNNVKVGANTVVFKDLPNNAVVAPAEFKVLSLSGNRRPANDQAVIRDMTGDEVLARRTVASLSRNRGRRPVAG